MSVAVVVCMIGELECKREILKHSCNILFKMGFILEGVANYQQMVGKKRLFNSHLIKIA